MAARLSLTRILVCVVLLVASLVENAGALPYLMPSPGTFGIMTPFTNISNDPRLWTLVDVFVPLAALVALVGYRVRVSLLIAALAYMVETGLLRSHNYFYNPGLIAIQMAFALALTPCGDVLSLDAKWGRTRRKSEKLYRWSLVIAWLPLAMTYLMAGMNKLVHVGADWFAPDTLRSFIALNQTRYPMVAIDVRSWFRAVPDVIWSALAIFTVVIEIGYVSVLWSRYARWVFPVLAISLHIGIWVLLGAQFFDLILLQLAVFPLGELWSYATKSRRSVSLSYS